MSIEHSEQQSRLEKSSNSGPFPIELLLTIFSRLDGLSIATCSKVCWQWYQLIYHYDDIVWPSACHSDFEQTNTRRFWSLQFPDPAPTGKRNWQDMYRFSRNWYTGHCKAYYPKIGDSSYISDSHLSPCTVVGTPQEQGMFTTLTLSLNGKVIRSNPNYHHQLQEQHQQPHTNLMVQSPLTHQKTFLQPMTMSHDVQQQQQLDTLHSIVCHYTCPTSNLLVTGELNGTVAVWDLSSKKLIRRWTHGHRGRVLCVSMNQQVVVSGGSDSKIRVWDLKDKHHRTSTSDDDEEWLSTLPSFTTKRRGMIDITTYLSGSHDWYQGVGEVAINGNLVACAPDASGPILIFSLLTGSLVYELRPPRLASPTFMSTTAPSAEDSDETVDSTAFIRLCLTPFFLLTKGKVSIQGPDYEKLVPSKDNIVQERREYLEKRKKAGGYVIRSDSQLSVDQTSERQPPVAQMTPYQLYQYYQSKSIDSEVSEDDGTRWRTVPQVCACINVWDLRTGKIIHRLIPKLEKGKPYQNYSITDIRVSPDFSKVFASIEVRDKSQYEEKLFCWDFAIRHSEDDVANDSMDMKVMELDTSDKASRKTGKSWVCFM